MNLTDKIMAIKVKIAQEWQVSFIEMWSIN